MTEADHFGPLIGRDGVTFRLWAPQAKNVALVISAPEPMQRANDGWFTLTNRQACPGAQYKFRIDEEIEVPDPASRFQPSDVQGPSEVVDQTYNWKPSGWQGRPWHECIFLETHVGTFTPSGTFRGMIEKLDHIVDAGFTAVELMPFADFSGRWNWGYDGVLWFAPDNSYGRPDDLKALVDAAHARGLMMFLDVVYNHFGPEGNYLGRYAPQFFTKADTPWGNAIDYGSPTVRRFAVENAIYWLRDFRFDGLRLDAVHAITEPDRTTLLSEMSKAAGALAGATGRHIHLVVENDANQATLLDPVTDPPVGKFRAQWNDDYHHAFHVLLTGETQGYYSDYRDARRHLARTLAQGFAYQGEPSPHRNGEPRGEDSAALPATAFVNFLQNHDQIGNRALGERLSSLVQPEALAAATAVLLLSPAPPLMFMGDEWGAHEPFPFFCDFKGELAEAVRNGRQQEFSAAYAAYRGEVPDPLSEQTLRLAALDWKTLSLPAHRARLHLVRDLIVARKRFIIPLLPALTPGESHAVFCDTVLTARWAFRSGETLAVLANLGDRPSPRPDDFGNGRPIWGEPPAPQLVPWAVHAEIRAP